ncbi:RsmE family RNA methyltransferase [Leptospira sarikeiensis]|uniref:Ribosomal RNA small subunit methyltransferase E n=1 Tax=Leptospira sarikeiensis TaxID=2484943 RepID=A0A4R9KC52_9LEPT|nr:RsmE family RNA methyltransferase [Leptospira sarikeiensis]TGL62414.1 RsmE family RNA methyltransferase [Leptospira sarikeiensis]
MNYLILDPSQKQNSGEFLISDQTKILHIRNVLKKKAGDSIKAGLIDNSLGKFKILSLNDTQILGKYTQILKSKERSPKIRLVVSVQRPPTVEKILELAGVWGVSYLEFRLAELSRREYLTSPVWREEKILEKLILGMEQGGNVFLPKIELGFSLPGNKLKSEKKATISERVLSGSENFFYLDKKGPKIGIHSSSLKEKEYSILIGPEAGWTYPEIQIFQKQKIRPLGLSKSILRSEQAVSFFLSQWEAR